MKNNEVYDNKPSKSPQSKQIGKQPGKSMVSRSPRDIALEVMVRVQHEKAYSQLVLDHELQKQILKNEDRRLVTEMVYGTLTHLLTIDYYLTPYVKIALHKLDPWVKCLLELSVYQLCYLDRIPEHAIVNEAVLIAKRRGHAGIYGMVNGVLRNIIRNKDSLHIPQNISNIKRISLTFSHPEWLVERWISERGEDITEQICMANNQQPPVSIRTNLLKTTRAQLIQRLQELHIEVKPSTLTKSGIVMKYDGNIAHHELYQAGYFTIQDESSMLVAEVLDPRPGMQVLDCCAAPGGKTTHIAEMMENTGHVWANDVHAHKENIINQQAERLGIRIIQTSINDARKLNEQFAEPTFDRILLDAPCSGFGVIRRKPDVKWRKTIADIEQICHLQYELLTTVAPLTQVGGMIVYSTCTMEKAENELIIARFLEEHPNFKLISFPESVMDGLPEAEPHKIAGQIQIFPFEYGSDGFFIARMSRIG